MARTTYIQFEGRLYEKGVDELPEAYYTKHGLGGNVAGYNALWGDRHYDGLVATDGTDISTRTKHREYMRKHGLTTIDDFSSYLDQRAKERAEFYTSGGDHRARREAVARALYQAEQRRRR